VSEALARVRNDSILSRPARASASGLSIARILAQSLRALPTRVYVIAGLSALLVGIGVNAVILQSHRHPAPLFAPPARVSPPPPSAVPAPSPPAPAPSPPPIDAARESPPPASIAPVPARPPQAAAGSAARSPDPIGNWLRTETQADDSHLVLAAQSALVKLGYAVKADGNEGAATHQALRDFERAHGLPPTTEITPRLVRQLNAAARSAH
jgi:hypothetical protein